MNAETTEQPVVDPARASVLVARDTDAEFVDFVTSAGAYLYRTAYLLSGDAHQAEELVQATFERTYRAWSKARAGEPRAYARRILMNLRIDGWRKDRLSAVIDDGVVPISVAPDHADDVVVRDDLVRALHTLPPRQRRVVVLRHLLDLSEAQVADELGISVGTVKSTNARGLARLRSLLSASAIDAVPEFQANGQQVLRQAQAAARRRRVVQGAVAVASVFVVVLGLMLAGPVRVPGVGTVALPGSEWLRAVLGLDERGLAGLEPDHVDTVACTRPEADAPNTQIAGTLPWTLRMADDNGSVVTVSDSTVLKVAEARAVALADDVLGWTTALGVSSAGCNQALHLAALEGTALTGTNVRERVCAAGSSWDGVVVARQEGSGGPGIGAGDGGSTVFELVSGLDEAGTAPLLSIPNADLDFEPVSVIGYHDGRLVFAVGDLMYVVDVRTHSGYQLRGASAAAIDVSSDAVAWSTVDGAAYVLVSRDGSPSVFRLSSSGAAVGVHGQHIAWTELGDYASMTFGRVRW